MKFSTSSQLVDSIYDHNLYFYTILKILVQCKLTTNKYIQLQSLANRLGRFYKGDAEGLRANLINTESVVKYNVQARSSYDNLIGLIENHREQEWLQMLDVGIDLLLFKDLIIQEAKAYTINKQQQVEKTVDDHLSIEYDMSNLCLPYGQKVLSSLLVSALTDINRKTEFLLSSSNVRIKQIYRKISALAKTYQINCNNMLILIVDESVAQSIKSTAGLSYESRVEYMIKPLVDTWNGHSHDKNIYAMEYDFTFSLANKTAGISAKRTLRERYKQNHEDINRLDVDCVFVFTLGTDLNRDKLDSLLQKDKNFVVVADEIYHSKAFLEENPKVFSSKELSREKLIKIISSNL